MKDYYKEKIRMPIALRNNLFACLVVIIGGTIGLFLTDINIAKVFPFLFAGIYFGLRFLLNLLSVNKEIDIIFEGLKNECK